MLVVPSDTSGVGRFRSVSPHTYIGEHYGDEFHIDIVYIQNFPKDNLVDFFKQYDLIHFHKQLDPQLNLINTIKFLDIPVIMDIDDHYLLGNDHPMSISAKKEQWHVPIINHLKAADYVTTTTEVFAKELSKHNKNVYVFPNAIDGNEAQYKPIKNPSDKLRVGIVCGSSHLKDIELMKNISEAARPDTNVQLLLCGFDTRGTKTIYHQDTGQVERRDIRPDESVWFEYEKIVTNNYQYLSKEHVNFLMKFTPYMDDPFVNEPYRRMWTRDINKYATHYQNVDVLLAPLKENEFNKMKSQLKEIEAGFTNTALIAQNFGAYTIDLTNLKNRNGVIDENATAMLVESRKNHKDWRKNIEYLAAHPEYVDLLKKNLREMVINKYSIEEVCKNRVAFYKKIVEEHNK